MKTLVVIAHPDLKESKVNSAWIHALEKEAADVHIHHLYAASTNGNFDILKEQKLIEQFDKIVLQFPIYWFNCPPLVKTWLDDVFTYGWAYGSVNKMKNRDVSLLVTAGIKADGYTHEGKSHYTLEEILVPFEITFNYMDANYTGFHAFYGAEHDPTDEDIQASIPEMLAFVKKIS